MEKYRLYFLFLLFPPPSSPTVSDTVGSAPPPRDGPGGIRASDLKAPLNFLAVHPPDPPKIQNPESKIQNSPIQNPKSKLFRPHFGDFGFWILDRYVAFLYMRPPPPQISGILDFGFWILEPYVPILLVQILGFGILDFGFWFGGVFADIFWMLHNIIITVHADSGRQISC